MEVPVPDRRNTAIEAFVAYLRDRQWCQEWRHQISQVLQDLAVDYHVRAVEDDGRFAAAGSDDDESEADMNWLWHNFFVKGLKKFIRSYPANNPFAVEAAVDQLTREEIELKAELQCGKVVFPPQIPHKYMNHPDGQSPAQALGPGFEMLAKPKVVKLCGNHPVSHEIVGCSAEGVTTVRITNVTQNIEWVVNGPATLQIVPAGAMVPAAAVADGDNVVAGAVNGSNNVVPGAAENPNKKRKVEVISEGEA
ncbi:hypothetical protein QBC45DRAFT_397724 [Copromyces sp. CBS 386.78]|nr:hypothetical protein QBC45DRAFT_397724 [Copromyces sp. CBS 386.78]